jgi:hypothetical protein
VVSQETGGFHEVGSRSIEESPKGAVARTPGWRA